MSAKPAGTFCWADLVPGDQKREAAFYRSLVGWSIAPGTEESAGYAGAAISDAQPERSVAGIMGTQTGFDGFDAFAEPGAFCWTEAHTRDPAKTRDFFAAVFGLDTDVMSESVDFTYYRLTAQYKNRS